MAYTTIKKPSDYFNTVLYNGNGSAQSITGVGFQPDFIWNKARNQAYNHRSFDVVVGENKSLLPNGNFAVQNTEGVTFDSDGFSFDRAWGGDTNQSGATYVAWNWLASNTTASNTDGSITSTVSANTTSGFSIVKYTGNATSGATVGHGLGVTPKVIIIKGLGTTYNWIFGHNSLSTNWTNYLTLSTTDVSSAATNIFNDTAPTSSVFSIGNALGVNTNSSDYIAYCFAEKQGFSKFGSYVGNGSTDGTFIYTGFKPAFVLYKNTTQTDGWFIHDDKRQGYNPENELLFANLSNAESTVNRIDLFSNGFKATDLDKGVNASGNNYIYMAFAAEPLVGDNPCTAR